MTRHRAVPALHHIAPLRRSLIPLVTLSSLWACSGGSSSLYTWAGRIDSSASEVVVYNPAEPLLEDGDIVVREDWTIRSEIEAVGDDFWENPTQVRATDRHVYLLDPPAHRIHVISTTGSRIRSFGQQGDGPGEFQQPRAISPMGTRLMVADGGKSTLEIIESSGEFVHSVPIGRIIFTAFAAASDKIMVNSFAGAGDSGWRVYSLDGSSTPFSAGDSLSTTDLRGPGYRPADGKLLAFARTVPTVQFLQLDGRTLRTIVIDREPEESTPAELDSFADDIRQTMGRSGIRTEMIREAVTTFREMWQIKPKYLNARYDRIADLTVIQEQNPQDLGSGPATIHVLTGSGIFLGSIPFSEPWVDFDLLGGRLYVLTRDPETDLAVLNGYTIVIPERALEFARGLVD